MLTLNKIMDLMNQTHCDNQKLASALGLNRQVVTDWKAGRSKSYKKYLPQIADYFHVSVEYLLGKSDQQETLVEIGELTQHDRLLLNAYHAQPEIQAAVDRLLGIEDNGKVLLWAAASSATRHPEKLIAMDKNEWDKIKNAPETEDPLL